jgi:hypothetical protein
VSVARQPLYRLVYKFTKGVFRHDAMRGPENDREATGKPPENDREAIGKLSRTTRKRPEQPPGVQRTDGVAVRKGIRK